MLDQMGGVILAQLEGAGALAGADDGAEVGEPCVVVEIGLCPCEEVCEVLRGESNVEWDT